MHAQEMCATLRHMELVRSLAIIACLALAGKGSAAPEDQSLGHALSDPVVIFAGCAGRFSAELEHRWLMSRDPGRARHRRQAMVDLLDAVRPSDRGPEILARRLEAKHAQAQLLQRAEFSTDPAEARMARQRARRAVAGCEALLLS
ncbi:hypothetical protein [Pseudooceanicola atlanticus]|uniref:hypothetical protein n=2 Tax=Pseudooceanicola atlanticus TaxID=1461694 RepID=UPI00138DE5F4|nr:hypothetical protein [Pseudooceanicola atlanticus]